MKKIIKGVTWLKILTLSITKQVRYIMVFVRDCFGVAFRAEANKNKVRGNGPITGLNRIKDLDQNCTKSTPKTFIYCLKIGGRGVILDGYHPQHVSRHNRSHAQSD